jgi:hypothetical protein
MVRYFCLSAVTALLLAPLAAAGDVVSGPEKGKPAPALKVFDVTGESKGKEVDYKAERKDRPTVYVFVRADAWDRPMARFLRGLDEAAQKEGEDTAVVAVWLTDDVKKTKAYLPKAQKSLQFLATALTCFTGAKDGPAGWGINADAHLTAVVVHKGRVAATFGYQSVNETNVPAVQKALKKALAKK